MFVVLVDTALQVVDLFLFLDNILFQTCDLVFQRHDLFLQSGDLALHNGDLLGGLFLDGLLFGLLRFGGVYLGLEGVGLLLELIQLIIKIVHLVPQSHGGGAEQHPGTEQESKEPFQ